MTAPRTIAFLPDRAFSADLLFAEGSRDGSRESFRQLRKRLIAAGRVVHTADLLVRSGVLPDLLVCVNIPPVPLDDLLPSSWSGVPRWVLLVEPAVVTTENYEPSWQAQFSRLFTWAPGLVDGERFVRLEQPNPIDVIDPALSQPDRSFALVAGNKFSAHPLELYTARREVIRWFERHHPHEFDLYGVGWNRLSAGDPRVRRALGRVLPRQAERILAPQFPSYRGPVESKREVLCRYHFTICFENARETEGYVTEKLFDCLLAGTIPVYWGAPEIDRLVPFECFVDYRDFPTLEDLYDHLVALSEPERARLREAGTAFLRSDAARPYSVQTWVDTLSAHLGV